MSLPKWADSDFRFFIQKHSKSPRGQKTRIFWNEPCDSPDLQFDLTRWTSAKFWAEKHSLLVGIFWFGILNVNFLQKSGYFFRWQMGLFPEVRDGLSGWGMTWQAIFGSIIVYSDIWQAIWVFTDPNLGLKRQSYSSFCPQPWPTSIDPNPAWSRPLPRA